MSTTSKVQYMQHNYDVVVIKYEIQCSRTLEVHNILHGKAYHKTSLYTCKNLTFLLIIMPAKCTYCYSPWQVNCSKSAVWKKILVGALIVGAHIFGAAVLFLGRSAFEGVWSHYQYPNCTRISLVHFAFDHTNLSDHSQYGPNPYGEYSVAVSVILQLLHIPEFLVLLRGCYKHRRKLIPKVGQCCTCNKCSLKCCCSIISLVLCSIIPLVLLFLFLYIFVGIAVGIFQLALAYCKTDANLKWPPIIRGILSVGAHMFTFLTRVLMTWLCIRVFCAYWKEKTNLQNDKIIDSEPNVTDPFRKASMIHQKLTEHYTNVADDVQPIIEIFASWFFIMWILYTIGTITNVVYVLRIWFLKISLSETQLIYELLYIGYNLLSYIIPYILALELKRCHTKYYKQLKDKQVTIVREEKRKLDTNPSLREGDQLYGYAITMHIMKRDDCDFAPSFFGVTLPLESIQFAIPILLPIISFTWGLVTALTG